MEVRFELTREHTTDLKSVPLDHSGIPPLYNTKIIITYTSYTYVYTVMFKCIYIFKAYYLKKATYNSNPMK